MKSSLIFRIFCLLMSIFFLAGCGPLSGGGSGPGDISQWYVSVGGNDDNDCHSFVYPCEHIATAIERAAEGDTIHLSVGTFYENLVINKSLILVGVDIERTFLDGSGVGPTVTIGEPISYPVLVEPPVLDVAISALTIQNGSALPTDQGSGTNMGGGLKVNNGNVTLWSLGIVNNTAEIGAGLEVAIYQKVTAYQVIIANNHSVGVQGSNAAGAIVNAGTLSLTDSTIANNTSELDGGGIVNYPDGDLTLTRCYLFSNSAGRVGGGLLNTGGMFRIYDSTIEGNSAYIGGGIASFGMSATLERVTLMGNHAEAYGGAVALISDTTLLATNSTLDGNTASHGGAIALGFATGFPLLPQGYESESYAGFFGEFLTITDNQAGEGGGVYNFGAGLARFDNSILSGNTGSNCSSEVFGDGNLSSDASCAFDGEGNLSNTDPMLGPLADNGGYTLTHLPSEGSPVIDAATVPDNSGYIEDQRGLLRPQDGDGDKVKVADIGAVEVKGAIAHLVTPSGPITIVFIPDYNANCHSGPGTNYGSISIAMEGLSYPIDGRNYENNWFHILVTPQIGCWVSGDMGAASGDTESIQVLQVPEITVVTPVTDNCSAYTTKSACEAVTTCKWVVLSDIYSVCTSK